MSCYICNDKCMELQDELRSNIKGISTPIIIDGKEINPVDERMRENRIIASKVYYVVDMYGEHTEGKYEDLLGEVCVFCYHFKEGHDYGRNENWPISSSQMVCSPAQPLFFYEKGEKGGFLTATQIYKAYDIEKIKSLYSNLDTVSFWKIENEIKLLEDRGYSTRDMRTKLHRSFAFPFFLLSMILLSGVFTLGMSFKENNWTYIFVAIITSVIIFYFNDFSAALGKTGKLPVEVSVWMPIVIIFIFGAVGVIHANQK